MSVAYIRKVFRNIPETFKGLGLPQQIAFCPQKAMLAGFCEAKDCGRARNNKIYRNSTVT